MSEVARQYVVQSVHGAAGNTSLSNAAWHSLEDGAQC